MFYKTEENSIKRRLKQNAVRSLQTQGTEPEIWRLTFKTENIKGKYNIQIRHRVIQLSSVSPWRKKERHQRCPFISRSSRFVNQHKKMNKIKSNKKSWQLILTPSVKHPSPCQGRSEKFYWIHWVVLSFQAPVCVFLWHVVRPASKSNWNQIPNTHTNHALTCYTLSTNTNDTIRHRTEWTNDSNEEPKYRWTHTNSEHAAWMTNSPSTTFIANV